MPTEKITLAQLESFLLKAADALRAMGQLRRLKPTIGAGRDKEVENARWVLEELELPGE